MKFEIRWVNTTAPHIVHSETSESLGYMYDRLDDLLTNARDRGFAWQNKFMENNLPSRADEKSIEAWIVADTNALEAEYYLLVKKV